MAVSGGIYLEGSRSKPTFLNLDGAYPKEQFTLVIWDSVRVKFSHQSEQYLLNKHVCVTGRIKKYRGRPEMVVNTPGSLVVKNGDKSSQKE